MTRRRTDIAFVTSCSLSGWELYGKKCFPSLLQYCPEDVTVHLVSEDPLPLDSLPLQARGRLSVWCLSASVYERAFNQKYKFDPLARGRKGRGYSYLYDAWKFSKKVFALQLVESNLSVGRLFWLDADVSLFAPLPRDVLLKLCPDDCNISYLARRNMHSECGFVGYNLNTPGTSQFISDFARLYATGEVFQLKEWHDSYVFDWLRKKSALSSSPIKGFEIPHTNSLHPFNYSELGQYMDHWKGSRKQRGHSYDHPMVKQLKEMVQKKT